MTGTADTEAYEFQDIYGLETVVIPTHRKMIRVDEQDKVFRTEEEKYRAIIRDIQACHARHQPVLVGTTSIENSERLSKMLDKLGIDHNVLNAKQHEREAQVILEAGRPGVVTIATNMAGRGTDIVLGGGINKRLDEINFDNELSDEEKKKRSDAVKADWLKLHDEVVAAGGLRIIGSERHESRRIDNQLRGRSGRQGDPGESRFYISLEDDLMRLFGSERIMSMMNSLGVDENTPIDSKMLTNAIESAQKRLESRNFQTRKHVLEYDDVMNVQRETIYKERRMVLDGEDVHDYVTKMLHDTVTRYVCSVVGEGETVDAASVVRLTALLAPIFVPPDSFKENSSYLLGMTQEQAVESVLQAVDQKYAAREAEFGSNVMRELERIVLLRSVDEKWMDHIDAMDEFRRGIGLRAYGQTDPILAYKKEGYDMFEAMVQSICEDTARNLMTFRFRNKTPERQAVAKPVTATAGDGTVKKKPVVTKAAKVGRNDPCPCGSGKKYKKCCGFTQGGEQ